MTPTPKRERTSETSLTAKEQKVVAYHASLEATVNWITCPELLLKIISRLDAKVVVLENANTMLKTVIDSPNKLTNAKLYGENAELKADNKRLAERVEKLESPYHHRHKAKYITVGDKDILTDECDTCGLDLRDPIHRALTPTQKEPNDKR